MGYNYINDYLVRETTKLYHNSVITNSELLYSPDEMSGNYLEGAYSWKINEQITWDCGIYYYYLLNYDFAAPYFAEYRMSFGVKSGIYLTFN